VAITSFNAGLAALFGASLIGLALIEIGQRIERRARRNRKDG
jgi:hypothetical protein